MKLRYVQISLLATLTAMLAGCASQDAQAVAPGSEQNMVGAAPESRNYSLYRAVGFDDEGAHPVVLKVWTVFVPKGQKLGFRWVTDQSQKWAPRGAFHLEAFANGDLRNLGAFTDRDQKFVWATSNADVLGYFHHVDQQRTMQIVTLN